jgi:hypothetical protein
MESLGAERIYPYGEGNAEGNHTEDDFNEWKKRFWQVVIRYYQSKNPNHEKNIEHSEGKRSRI